MRTIEEHQAAIEKKFNKPTPTEAMLAELIAEGKRTNALLLKLVAIQPVDDKKKTKRLTKNKK